MSVTQEQLRAIVFYEWRGGIGATAPARSISSRLGEGTTAIRIVKRWFANGDTDFEDKPRSGRSHSVGVEDSAILDAVKKDPVINTRIFAMRLGCSHLTVVRPSATEKCWLDGSLTP
ncbi:hypothetical protein RB195_023193 [Necator americanus]|uniref:Mos1 transposase HTH domain-containing protein n=1 Tax=Necator americanus TaxID=51031 RepID=A0ABR1EIE5_NECAM